MNRRLELQTKLEELLGSRNVYYQPPESLKMEYPAIRYSKSNINSRYADDIKYSNFTLYEIVVIDKRPDIKEYSGEVQVVYKITEEERDLYEES